METKPFNGTRIGMVGGIFTAIALIAYFIIMYWAGLAYITEFRLFNFLILFAVIYWTMRRQNDDSGHTIGWFDALGGGCIAVLTAVDAFSVFMFIFLFLNPDMMAQIRHHAMGGEYLTPTTSAIGVFMEGFSSGMIMAYIFLSWADVRQNAPKHEHKGLTKP